MPVPVPPVAVSFTVAKLLFEHIAGTVCVAVSLICVGSVTRKVVVTTQPEPNPECAGVYLKVIV